MNVRRAAMMAACAASIQVLAADGTWKGSGGNWSDASSWIGGIPQNAGDSAIFGPLTTAGFVDVGQPFTIGSMLVNSANGYSFYGFNTGKLTFDNSGKDASLTVSGDQTFAVALTWNSTLDLTVTGNSILSAFTRIDGDGDLKKLGTGTLILLGDQSLWSGDVHVDEGILKLSYPASAADTFYKGISSGAVSISAGATLDLDKAARTSSYKGALTNAITFSGSGAAGLGAIHLGSSSDVVLSGALTISGGAVLRSDATNTATIGFAIGDPVSGAGSLGGSGGLTLLHGGTGTALASFQLNVRSGHTGGTVLDGTRLLISSVGSLVGTGNIQIKNISELDIDRPAGDDPLVAPVSPHSVVLSGGTLLFTTKQDVMSYLSANSGNGQVLLQNTQYDAGTLDFSTLAGTPRLGATGTVDSSIAASVVLRPDTSGHTLFFGAPAQGTRALVVNPIIADVNGVPTSVEQGLGGTLALTSANTYSGATMIRAGFMRISNASALGTASGSDADGTKILAGGELDVGAGLNIGNERMHLLGGKIIADPTSVLNGAIIVDVDSTITGGEQHGPISGAGALVMGVKGSTQILSGDNTFTGPLRITAGTVEARSATALGASLGGTSVESGAELYLTSSSSEPITVTAGTLHLGATSNYSGSAVLVGGKVNADAGSIFNGTLEIRSGTAAVAFSGNGTIRKTQSTKATLGVLSPAFDGPIRVEEGTLSVFLSNMGSTNGATFVGGSGVMELIGGASSEPIFLQNANGAGEGGLINKSNATVMNGPLDLGDKGSSVGFAENINGTLTVNGPISGGSLAIHSDSTVANFVIGSNANTYTGVTVIDNQATLLISAGGSLTTTSGIAIQSGGNLLIAPGSVADRIASVPISLRGGTINAQSLPAEVGAITIEPGFGTIEVSGPGGVSPGTLTINSITHAMGGIVQFGAIDATQDESAQLGGLSPTAGIIRIKSPPLIVNGIMGGWAVLKTGSFATYGPNGIQPAQSSSTDINSALPTDNVEHIVNSTLLSSRTINSLLLDGANLSLGNNTLTIQSGGISQRSGLTQAVSITGGKVLPGAYADGQLFLIGGMDFASTIEDVLGKPTTVVVSGNGVNLRGISTYTGGTFLTGYTTVSSPTALPTGGDLTMSGAQLYFSVPNDMELQIGKLTMRDPYQYSSTMFTNHGVGVVTLNATSYDMEAGYIDLPLGGNGTLTKSGVGTLTLHLKSDQYNGEVDINQGTLQAGDQNIVEDGVTGHGLMRIHSGASLLGRGKIIYNSTIQLEGGTIGSVQVNGDLHVMADSQINSTTVLGTLTIDRGATLFADTTRGLMRINGSVKVNGVLASNGSTPVEISPVGGKTVSGDGLVQGNVTIRQAVLAPGEAGRGTFQVIGNVTIGDNGKLHVGIPLDGLAPSLAITGNVDLSSTLDQLELIGGHAGQTFGLISYTGTLTGLFNTVSTYYSVNYDQISKLISVTVQPIPGDANDDRLVDFRDFQRLELNFGKAGGLAQGDFDGSGVIDRADLAILLKDFSQPARSDAVISDGFGSADSVPEPAGALLMLTVCCVSRSMTRRVRRGR